MKFIQVSLQKRGAAAIDAYEMSEALCARGFMHTVVLSSENELRHMWQVSPFREVVWVKTYQSNIWSFALATLTYWRIFEIKRILRSMQPDYIYATHFHPWLHFIFKRMPAKKILTFHENPFDAKEPDRLINWQKKLVTLSDLLIVHSDYMKAEMQKAVSKKIISLPLGSYESVTLKQVKPKHERAINFLFFGRIVGYKGLESIISAWKILRSKHVTVNLTVSGSGWLDPKIAQELVSLGAKVINRWQSFDDMCEMFRTHDVVLVPYSRATQSGVVSLAMAFNLPVIAAPVGGLPEQVKDGVSGLLAGTPQELAAAAERLYNDPALYQQLSSGIETLKRAVSWKSAAEILIQNLP